jgi:hypothetical protein
VGVVADHQVDRREDLAILEVVVPLLGIPPGVGLEVMVEPEGVAIPVPEEAAAVAAVPVTELRTRL